MSYVPIKDADDSTRKVDVVTRTEGPDTVETQAVAVVDPTNGSALKPKADGSVTVDPAQVATLSTEATLAALKATADAIQTAAAAIQSSVSALNSKTTAVNTGAIAGAVSVSNFPASQTINGNVGVLGAVEILNDVGNAIPVSSTETRGGGAVDAQTTRVTLATDGPGVSNLALINADLGAPADPAATTDTGTFSITAFIKRLFSRLPLLKTTIPENDDPGVPVRIIGQDIWNVSFADSGGSILAPEFNAPIVGTGVGYSQATGNLLITAGTTANSEFLTRSARSWEGALRLRFATVLSQRIANNNFAVLLADLIGEGLTVTVNSATSITVSQADHPFTAQSVGQFVLIGGIALTAAVPGRYAIASVVPGVSYNLTVAGWPASGSTTATVFGHSYVRNLFTGTTATNVNFDTQRRGWAAGDTVATINTTASPGTIVNNEVAGREVYLSDQLRASTTTPTVGTRGSRLENIPDDNQPMYVFIWAYNGTTNPASGTTWTISFCAVEKFANHPVYIQGNRANGSINPLPVTQQGTTTVSGTVTSNIGTGSLAAGTNAIGDVGIQLRANATGAATTAKLVSAATTNATVVKASAGRVVGWQLQNTTASIVYVKFHNQTTTPTAGAAVALPVAIPANGKSEYMSEAGIAFATGIGITTVTGAADVDAVAVAANAIVGSIHFA